MILAFTSPVWTLYLINLSIFEQDENHEDQLSKWELAVRFLSVAYPIGMMIWLVFGVSSAFLLNLLFALLSP